MQRLISNKIIFMVQNLFIISNFRIFFKILVDLIIINTVIYYYYIIAENSIN